MACYQPGRAAADSTPDLTGSRVQADEECFDFCRNLRPRRRHNESLTTQMLAAQTIFGKRPRLCPGYYFGPPKSRAGRRVVPFPDLIAQDLGDPDGHHESLGDDALVQTPAGTLALDNLVISEARLQSNVNANNARRACWAGDL